MLEHLVDPGSTGSHSIDSTSSKAHRCAAGGKGGAENQAIGRSRGGRTTKIHAVANAAGCLIACDLTPGQMGDVRPAPPAHQALAAFRATMPPLRKSSAELIRDMRDDEFY